MRTIGTTTLALAAALGLTAQTAAQTPTVLTNPDYKVQI
jgi:hypothetical protein